jgi:glucosylceramidase
MAALKRIFFKQKNLAVSLGLVFFIGTALPVHAVLKGKVRVSTNSSEWANEAGVSIATAKTSTTTIVIDTTTKYQTINAFGGCFNEIGARALKAVDTSLSNSVMKELFDTVTGCKFNICRMPIGASDFAVQTSTLNRWYSLDDTVNDTDMKDINIRRDEIYLIPYIKSAMVYRPNLKIWASPWSPPIWMKVNDAVGAEDLANGDFIQSSTYLKAYALYLAKAVNLFQAAGINLYGLSVQNEPYTDQAYPCCLWTAAQIRDFIKLYVGPTFVADKVNCEIWSPTMNNGSFSEFNTWLGDTGSSKYITTVCFQYQGEDAIAAVYAAYPNKTLYETELECGSGTDDWTYAESTCFQQMQWYFDNDANGFMQWNMVLDQSGSSSWGWVQCAMITVDTTQKTVTFHPQHYCAKHFSYYVQPGARRINTSGGTFTTQVGFKNPDGSVVVVANNTATSATSASVCLGTSIMNVSMPAHSFDTYIFYDSATTAIQPSNSSAFANKTEKIKIIRTGNGISIFPHGTSFNVQVVRLDGCVIAAKSSNSGSALTIRSDKIAPGVYFIKGTIDGLNYQERLPLQ